MKRYAASLVLAVLAAAAGAQSLPDRPIRRAEVAAAVKRQFARIDANHDGVVTRAEFERFRASPAGQAAAADPDPFGHIGGHWLDHADPNGTGRATLAMAQGYALHLFDMADVNRDGTVGVDEMRMAQAMRSLGGH